MPRPGLRTTFLKKIKKRLPGGGYIIHYKRKDPSVAKCATCKKPLKGVNSGSIAKIKNAAKSVKRPTRAYGGNLCATCAKKRVSQDVFKGKV
ncbi:MAG: 50S ribosomal protein L34e [Nanoarchaeota archaeon]